MRRELRILLAMLGVFGVAYALPLSDPRVRNAIQEAFRLLQWYARNHTLACVVPAIFIAGAITTFLTPSAVMKHLGPRSKKRVAYPVAAVSGGILAVCSCSVLPMFAGIYRLGAGLGPASAFLYSGPAINVLAVFLTARVLGVDLGVARAVGAIGFAIVIGLAMAFVFRREEAARLGTTPVPIAEGAAPTRSLRKTTLLLAAMVAFLVFSDWYNPGDARIHLTDGREVAGVVLQETAGDVTVQLAERSGDLAAGERLTIAKDEIGTIETSRGWVMGVWHMRWYLAGLMGLAVLLMTRFWMDGDERREWMANTWGFAKLLVPLLFGGVFVVGFLSALLPDQGIGSWVGDNGLFSNLTASVVGALFYFATLTEIPIVEALRHHGMAEGPALALLLAGPALSLPNLLVIGKVMGWRKTTVFSLLVVVMATVTGLVYGAVAG